MMRRNFPGWPDLGTSPMGLVWIDGFGGIIVRCPVRTSSARWSETMSARGCMMMGDCGGSSRVTI